MDFIHGRMAEDRNLLNSFAHLLARGPEGPTRFAKLEPPGTNVTTTRSGRGFARMFAARLDNRAPHKGIILREEDQQWFVLRMAWRKVDGVWRGRWVLQKYDRAAEWDTFWDQGRVYRDLTLPAASAGVGVVLQEVLYYIVQRIHDPVSAHKPTSPRRSCIRV